VKLIVPTCMPAAVGLPRNHGAEPANAGLAVIIGIHEDLTQLAVTTKPCAVSGPRDHGRVTMQAEVSDLESLSGVQALGH
jgi:hypothetical protein